MSRYVGRRTPYTQTGIRRCACIRCGQPAEHQWQACANGNRFVPLCVDCDIALNRVVLKFMKILDADDLIGRYIQQLKVVHV